MAVYHLLPSPFTPSKTIDSLKALAVRLSYFGIGGFHLQILVQGLSYGVLITIRNGASRFKIFFDDRKTGGDITVVESLITAAG